MNEPETNKSNMLEKEEIELLQKERREFLKQSVALAGLSFTPISVLANSQLIEVLVPVSDAEKVKLSFTINTKSHDLLIDPRTTLLDLLREQLGLTGTKKGCDFGQCGACTVLVDGQRVLSCLSFAVMQEGKKVSTVEGLSKEGQLHPMQKAFIKHDGFQCGYCTPGQLMSAIACVKEGKAETELEIQEYMSGNLCRCGAYPNIVNAIVEVKNNGDKL